jgi:hypothetical protein
MTEKLSDIYLKSELCKMTEIVRTSQGYEVSLPQAYSSGHVVAVVVSQIVDGFVVHDNSYASMILDRSGTKKALSLTKDVSASVEHYGCKIDDGRVTRHVASLDEVALAAVLVGCASRLVADQILKVDHLSMYDFKSKLIGKVSEIVGSERVKPNHPVSGHHGSKYKVSAVVFDRKAVTPLAFIEPIGDSNAVARKFKEFYDISGNPAYRGIDFVSVIDDDTDISTGDALLMQEVSNLIRFSDAATRFGAWNTLQ